MTEALRDPEPPPPEPEPDPRWGGFRRWAFRFALVYIVLYVLQDQMGLPFSLVTHVTLVFAGNELPGLETAGEVSAAMNASAAWVDQAWEDTVAGATWLFFGDGVKAEDRPSGSGDTTFDFLSLLTIAVLALLASAAWSLLDRRPRRHWRLLAALTIVIRYELATTMLVYGFMKLFPLQFPGPYPYRMAQAFGDASPMGLLWTFMGTSPTYTSITGAIEVLGGVLLLFRRTTTLGALITAGAMGNIAALNYCYDVPVKLLSTHMCALALLLVALDGRRLLDVFVLRRAAQAPELRAPFRGLWWPVLTYPVKVVVIAGLLYSTVDAGLKGMAMYGPGREQPELYGFYEVEAFERDGEAVPPLLTDGSRWRHVVVDGRFGSTYAGVKTMPGTSVSYDLASDAEAKTVTLTARGPDGEEPRAFVLAYERPAPKALVLRGELEGHTVVITLRLKTEEDFLLTGRGFRWITEMPFNR